MSQKVGIVAVHAESSDFLRPVVLCARIRLGFPHGRERVANFHRRFPAIAARIVLPLFAINRPPSPACLTLVWPKLNSRVACFVVRNCWFACGGSNVSHPLPNVGNGVHGRNLVDLPSHRVLSDQTGVSEGGDGRCCTSTASPEIARCVRTRSGWWLR